MGIEDVIAELSEPQREALIAVLVSVDTLVQRHIHARHLSPLREIRTAELTYLDNNQCYNLTPAGRNVAEVCKILRDVRMRLSQ